MFPSRTSEPTNHKLNMRILSLRYPQAIITQVGRKALSDLSLGD